ncbi:unnamed protein product [Enterobius vermicularis]|uniref:Condensin-2 complex subunit H2 n=1 Tax=Enterobius vermicularis TaxID=51028 RepID=A0A0N4VEI2_ENTVE|nr:unnamed protein product [Enterobius vermicularis]
MNPAGPKTHKALKAIHQEIYRLRMVCGSLSAKILPKNSAMTSIVDSHLEDAMKAYAPLFQPLKDLARNWTVDLEKCLEVLSRMKQVQEVERNSGGHFNFAQAALVVAGGAEVYGRKVDYVHQLTLGFFEQLSEKARRSKKGTADNENDENLPCDIPQVPDDPCEWVDLKKLRPADPKTLVLKKSACKPAKLLPQVISFCTFLFSITCSTLYKVFFPIPMELVPLTSEEKMDVPLYDSVNPNILIGMKDDFKMNTAFIHESGAMLLDLVNERIINEFTTKEIVAEVTNMMRTLRDADGTTGIVSLVLHLVANEVNGGAQGDGGDATLVGEAQQPAEIVRDEEFTHQDVLSKKGPSTQLLPDEMVPLILEKPAELFPSDDEGNFGGGDGYNDMDIEECGPPPHPADEEGFVDNDIDEVDIFTEFSYRVLPPKVIKPYNLASSLIQRQKKKLLSLGLNPQTSFMDYLHNEVYRNSVKIPYRKYDAGFNCAPLIAVSEFISKEEKRRNAFKNALRKQRRLNKEKQVDEEAAVAEEELVVGAGDDFADDVSEPEFNEFNNDVAEEEVRFGEVIDNEDMDSNFRDVIHGGSEVNDSVVPTEEMSFNARLRHYLNLYWAEGEEIHSKLDERVQKWDETVTPLLEEEERRRVFDIHDYGSELLAKFDQCGQQRGFFEVSFTSTHSQLVVMSFQCRTISLFTQNKLLFPFQLIQKVPDYEVSRYFLSSLMLANTYNLEITFDDDGFQGGNEMDDHCLGENYRLKLLKRDRHHEAIEQSVTS